MRNRRFLVLWSLSLPLAAAPLACFTTAAPSLSGAIAGTSTEHDGGTANPSSASSSGSAPDAASDGASSAGYSVSGPFVFDAAGKKHLFRGVARPSLEWAAIGDNLSQEDYDTMKTWGVNVVRISMNQAFWINDPANPAYNPSYAAVIDEQIQWAEGDGIDVILDLHWSDAGDFAQSPGQWCMADQNSISFWKDVANRYKGDPHILFELYNEPYVGNFDLWLHGGMTTCTSYQNNNGQRMAFSATFQAVGMQDLYDAVRSTGATNLVIAGGIGYAYDLSGVGKGYRITDGAGNPAPNLIYNTHPYNQPGKMAPSDWYNAFGYLAATDPVIATEFGDGTQASCATGTYDASIIPYFDGMGDMAPANPISWTAWAFFVGGCSFPSLLSDWNTYATTPSGDVVKAALQAFHQP